MKKIIGVVIFSISIISCDSSDKKYWAKNKEIDSIERETTLLRKKIEHASMQKQYQEIMKDSLANVNMLRKYKDTSK